MCTETFLIILYLLLLIIINIFLFSFLKNQKRKKSAILKILLLHKNYGKTPFLNKNKQGFVYRLISERTKYKFFLEDKIQKRNDNEIMFSIPHSSLNIVWISNMIYFFQKENSFEQNKIYSNCLLKQYLHLAYLE